MAFIMLNSVQAIDLDKISDKAYQTALRVGFDTILSTNQVAKGIKAEIAAAKFFPELKLLNKPNKS